MARSKHLAESEDCMKVRRFVISAYGKEIRSTNDDRHALRIVASTRGADMEDNRPDTKPHRLAPKLGDMTEVAS